MRSMRFTTGAMRRGIAAVAMAAAATLASAAGAQGSPMGGFGEIFKEDFSRRDLPILNSGLDLDEGQQFSVETLIEEYQDKVRAGVEKLRESFMKRQQDLASAAGNAHAVADLVFGPLEDWAAEKEKLRLQFIADLKQFLTDAQLERWPRVERKLNRMNLLKDGQISGENIDLFLVVREASLSAEQVEALNEIMDNYELEVDQLLVSRAKAVKELRSESLTAMKGGSEDGYRRTVDRVIALRVAMRDANEKYANALMAQLPPDAAAEFKLQYREAAYPRIFRATRTERLIKAALESPLVTPEQITQLRALNDRYQTDVAAANENLIVSMKLTDPQRERTRALETFSRMTEQPQQRQKRNPNDDPLREDFRKRDELENRYLMELSALLGPETFDTLPGANKGGGQGVGKEHAAPGTGATGGRSRGNSGGGEGGDVGSDKQPGDARPQRP